MGAKMPTKRKQCLGKITDVEIEGRRMGCIFIQIMTCKARELAVWMAKEYFTNPFLSSFKLDRDVWYNKSLWINFMMFIMSLKTYNYYTFETLGSECTAGNHRKMLHSIFRIECVPVASQTQPYLMCKTVLEHLTEKQKLHTPDVHHYTKIPLHNNTGQISY